MSSKNVSAQGGPLYRIPPFYFIHVLDQNSTVTRLEIGPKIFLRQDNEILVLGPEKMITIPPRHYCVIENPILKDRTGQVQYYDNGQVKLAYGDIDIRLENDYKDPFPLYPGENLRQPVTPVKFIPANSGLRLKAVFDFDDDGTARKAGDEWLFEGPGTYIPRKEVAVEEQINAHVIAPDQAVRLCAKKEMIDRLDQQRVTGEQWLIKQAGAYLPLVHETVVKVEKAHVLTDKKALQLRALKTFKDDFGHVRNNGDEWLVTREQTEAHILNVYEELVTIVEITILNSRQYCVILNPFIDGRNQLGKKKVIVGEKSFFLQPNEKLERGIQDVYILADDDGLVVKCLESFEDDVDRVTRVPGGSWLVHGPREYVPPVQVEVIARRKAIPLDANEGIYVRDVKTGRVRAVIGKTYMLNQDEELWDKELPPEIEKFLQKVSLNEKYIHRSKETETKATTTTTTTTTTASNRREKCRVVSYRVPQNAAVQIYDYKAKQSRIVFGPDLVLLNPDELFTTIDIDGHLSDYIWSYIFLLFLFYWQKFRTNPWMFYPAVVLLASMFVLRLFNRYIVQGK